MTDEQKFCIIQFRSEGMTYSEIAQKLNISINTVKSFYRRHTQTNMPKGQCKQCGKPITQSKRTREKKFCSDKCRMAWWKLHADEMNKKMVEIASKYLEDEIKNTTRITDEYDAEIKMKLPEWEEME